MKLISLTKYLNYSLEELTSLKDDAVPFNKFLFSIKILSNFGLLISTLSCILICNDISQEPFKKYHDLILFVWLTAVVMFTFGCRAKEQEVINFLLEPDEYFEPKSAGSEIVNDFHRQVDIFRKLIVGVFVVGPSLYILLPSIPLLLNHEMNRKKCCIRLVFGWVPTPSSFWVTVLLQIFSGVIFMIEAADGFFICLRLMGYMTLKITMQVRLLCLALNNMNITIEWPDESQQASCSSGKSILWEEDSMIHTASVEDTSVNDSSNSVIEPANDLISLRAFLRERLFRQNLRSYVKNIVDRHITVIRMTKLTEETFRFQQMINIQLGVIVAAFAVPKLGLDHGHFNFAHIGQLEEAVVFMIYFGILCYTEQTLIDASESLRQALYNCDWTDKPLCLRQDLLIMQTVATRPLRLTMGGVYTLNMETYGNVLVATYSYVSLIQSLT